MTEDHAAMLRGEALRLGLGYSGPTVADAPAESGSPSVDLESDAPVFVARRFGEARGDLWHWRGDFYAWTGACWRGLTEDDLRARLYTWLENAWARDAEGRRKAFRPDKTKVGKVIDALAGVRHLDDALDLPFWIDRRDDDPDPADLLPFENGVLDLRTFTLRAPDPRLFATHRVACDYNPAATAPTWERFLSDIFAGDDVSARCIEEQFGYCLTADTSQQKAFLWQGARRSGKGTCGRILRELVGTERFAAPTVSSFGSNFGASDFIGKAVAMIADARGQSRYDPHVIVERILTITGEDAQSIDRKYKSIWNGVLPTRLIYVSNVPPKLKDPSGVVVSRFIAINFQRSFEGREDTTLTRKLLDELPGIANRALAGLVRLRRCGRFEQPETGRILLDQMDENTGPVRAFVRDRCIIGPDAEVQSQALYQAFNIWCREHGHAAMAASTFGADLYALNAGIKKVRSKVRDAATGRLENGPPVYRGINLASGMFAGHGGHGLSGPVGKFQSEQ